MGEERREWREGGGALNFLWIYAHATGYILPSGSKCLDGWAICLSGWVFAHLVYMYKVALSVRLSVCLSLCLSVVVVNCCVCLVFSNAVFV